MGLSHHGDVPEMRTGKLVHPGQRLCLFTWNAFYLAKVFHVTVNEYLSERDAIRDG